MIITSIVITVFVVIMVLFIREVISLAFKKTDKILKDKEQAIQESINKIKDKLNGR